jgi:3-hydroxybenzoate 6-monooxygenase
MATNRTVPLLIVGGGLGGLATALALSKKGIASRVVEKSSQFGEIGAGLQIAPNASHVLDGLGVLEDVAKTAVFPARLVFLDSITGERVTYIDLGREFRARYRFPYFVMHRGDLLNALLKGCRASSLITLEPDKSITKLEDAGSGVRARFADGSVYECEALIGADGLHSTVRSFVTGGDELVCEPYVAYRGAIPIEDISEHAGLDNVVMWVGPGTHFVQYPLRAGELYNQVAVFRSRRYTPDSDHWGSPEELDEAFATSCAPLRKALSVIMRGRRWPMVHREPISQWTRNRVTLMGDAAHPMLQYIAQGACQAIEDAASLARRIAERGQDYPKAFAEYQNHRYLRTARVQMTARFFGDYVIHIGDVASTARNALLASRDPNDFSAIDWLYGYKD